MSSRVCALLILLGTAWLAAPAESQNLIVNGTFDQDLQGWDNTDAASWDMEDANQSSTSGSLWLPSPVDLNTGNLVWQCIAVSGETTYEYGAKFLIPAGQVGSAQVGVSMSWWETDQCELGGGGPISFAPEINSSETGTWMELSGDSVSPLEATGALLFLSNTKTANPVGAVVTQFDDAFVLPEPGGPALVLSTCATLLMLDRRRRDSTRRAGR